MNTHGLVWTTTWFVGTAQSLSPIWTQRTKPVPSTAAPMEENALLLGKNKMIIAHSRALRIVNTTLEPIPLMLFANVARNQTSQVNGVKKTQIHNYWQLLSKKNGTRPVVWSKLWSLERCVAFGQICEL